MHEQMITDNNHIIDMSCGWKEGFGWGEEGSEKGSVKQTNQNMDHREWSMVKTYIFFSNGRNFEI